MEHNFNFEKAKWIWLENKKINQYADFSTRLDFQGNIAELFVSVMTDYVLFINDKFVDCGIAEGNMIGVAAGLATTGYTVFASSFATHV